MKCVHFFFVVFTPLLQPILVPLRQISMSKKGSTFQIYIHNSLTMKGKKCTRMQQNVLTIVFKHFPGLFFAHFWIKENIANL